jgi:hypothetical protein
MQRVSRPYADGLDEWVREGDDGSWEVVAFYDQARSVPCASFPPGYEPAMRCLPSFNDATSSFADEACETPAAEIGECEETTPAALGLAERSGDACSSTTTYRFFEIADEGEMPTFAKDLDGSCVAYDTTPVRTRTAGAPIPAESFPALEIVEAGTARIHGKFYASEGKPMLPVQHFPGPWLDSTTGQACTPERFADGSIRCVTYAGLSPDATTAQSIDVFYTSDSCSGERLVPWGTGTCLVDLATPERAVVPATDACEAAGMEAVAVTGTVTPSSVYRTDDETGGCVPVDPVTLGAATYLVLGDTLDPATLFAEMSYEIRD